MAKRKKQASSTDTLVDLVQARDQAQDFFERNQKYILGGLALVVLVFGGWFFYKNLVLNPKQKEAVGQMWKAEEQFFQDSFTLALSNPGGGYQGFTDLEKKYSGVSTGNAANYYAGVSYLQLGQFEAAVSYLKDVKPKGNILPIMKYGALGDAYSELGKFDEALSNYKKAANTKKNEALTPVYLLRYGMLNEKLEKYAEARKAYQQLVDEHSASLMAKDAEKYLVRIEGK
ncbi:MAG: tetratricopeptide repeat protein [Saprospirales bacterium]|jgi:tetratricopeptide (TPR) repeat protein|nr:tetratricopeptide repeat protein [Saprospirales bacterium]MBK6904132.1 tetratricopeptide repeat protein [Saprospirales bacterium]MBK7335823.1 tetratricopeptide repeat protein [Saprospirales bacterium]